MRHLFADSARLLTLRAAIAVLTRSRTPSRRGHSPGSVLFTGVRPRKRSFAFLLARVSPNFLADSSGSRRSQSQRSDLLSRRRILTIAGIPTSTLHQAPASPAPQRRWRSFHAVETQPWVQETQGRDAQHPWCWSARVRPPLASRDPIGRFVFGDLEERSGFEFRRIDQQGQAALRRASAVRRSRARWPSILAVHHSTRDFGRQKHSQPSCPCHKQPWTKITVSYLGTTMSSLPGSCLFFGPLTVKR